MPTADRDKSHLNGNMFPTGSLNCTGRDLALNPTLIDTPFDLEGSLISPALIPGVDDDPVVLSVLCSPSNDLDGVATELRSLGVAVNARFVAREVRVYGKGTSDGAVLENVRLNLRDAREGVSCAGGLLVIRVLARELRLGARALARWCAVLRGWAGRILLGRHVVSARRKCVWQAGRTVGLSIVATGDDTGVSKPLPSHTRLATVAAKREALRQTTASGGIFRR
mmetsp:Transcript_210/g.276  ORF Transcript_210/g.276 Transcript_210/m.276 type:complete len:225 (+) Transcript_210:42-716(+)